MNDRLFDITNKILVTDRKADKALTILFDLIQRYAIAGDEPTKKERDKYSWEAKIIFDYIEIAFDYVDSIKNALDKACDDLSNLYYQNKQANTTFTDKAGE